MKLTQLLLACALGASVLPAFAQWQWVDKDGSKVFSDRAPPPEIPDNSIIRRPRQSRPAGAPAAATTETEPSSSGAPSATPAPAPSGDRALQDKKKQVEKQNADAEAAKRKAEEDRASKVQADNCARARSAQAGLNSGARLSRINEKGEREFFDENMRAEEGQRLQGVIQQDCK